MEFQSNYAKNGHEVERLGMEEGLGWEAATDQRPASFNASSRPPLMTTMGLCFPQNLASSSTLDPSLMAVECWKMTMPEQPSRDVLPTENSFLGNADPKVPRGNASQSVMSGLGNDRAAVQGPYLRATDQEMASGYHEGPASWQPATSPANIFLPNSSTGDSYNPFIPLQNPISWQMTTGDMTPSEVFAAFVNPTQAMMVPIPSASNTYTTSRPQSHSSGVENHSPKFEANVFAVPNSSPEEEYEPIPRSVPFGRDLSNVFVFGSSGATGVFFNPSYTSAIGQSSIQSQPSAHDTQNEESSVTWTKVEAMPASSVYPHGGNGDPVSPQVRSESGAGAFSTIYFHTASDLPGPQEAPPRMDELIVSFEKGPGVRPSKGKRKAFNPAERKKVKKVRENGACFSCRAKKVACTEVGICMRCLRVAKQDPQLARHVCLRNKFKDIYIGVKDIHGSLLARKGQLNDILASLIGPPEPVVVWVGQEPNAPKLQLQVMQCQSSASCRWKCLQKVNGIFITSHFVVDKRYVIVPSSVPSIDRLDLFGRKILSFSDGSHSGSITPLLDRFLLNYCRPNRSSRLRNLANETLRIASLNGLVAYGFINLHDGSYDLLSRPPSQNQRYVSETIHDQIRLRAAEGFEIAETHIFHELDNLREIIGSDDHNRIVAGICLLRLIVLYRERMVRDEIRLGLPRHGKRLTGHQARLEKAAIMYKRLTVVYVTLCSGSDSPIAMDWQSESGVEGGEEHQILRNAFVRLQFAYKEFCDEKLTQQHDDVFKRLIVEPARKGHGKGRKRKE